MIIALTIIYVYDDMYHMLCRAASALTMLRVTVSVNMCPCGVDAAFAYAYVAVVAAYFKKAKMWPMI